METQETTVEQTEEIKEQQTEEVQKEQEEEQKEESIFALVNKRTGYTIEGEFNEDETGIADYALKYKELGENEFENKFRQSFPDAYELAEHIKKGGSKESFFKAGEPDYTKVALDVTNESQLKNLIIEDLKKQGVPEKRIGILIKAIEDSGDLEEEGKISLDRLKTNQTENRKQIESQLAEQKLRDNQIIDSTIKNISDIVYKGEIGKFIIPQADKETFSNYVTNNLVYEDGEFYKVTKLNNDNLISEMQADYFKFKKGDLKVFVEKAAATENVRKLQKKIAESKDTKGQVDFSNTGFSLKDVQFGR